MRQGSQPCWAAWLLHRAAGGAAALLARRSPPRVLAHPLSAVPPLRSKANMAHPTKNWGFWRGAKHLGKYEQNAGAWPGRRGARLLCVAGGTPVWGQARLGGAPAALLPTHDLVPLSRCRPAAQTPRLPSCPAAAH